MTKTEDIKYPGFFIDVNHQKPGKGDLPGWLVIIVCLVGLIHLSIYIANNITLPPLPEWWYDSSSWLPIFSVGIVSLFAFWMENNFRR